MRNMTHVKRRCELVHLHESGVYARGNALGLTVRSWCSRKVAVINIGKIEIISLDGVVKKLNVLP